MNEKDMVTLDVQRRSRCSASDAAHLLPCDIGDYAIGLVYTSANAHFIARRNGVWEGPCGADPDFGECFELRVFDSSTEVRWMAEDGGLGTPVVVTEKIGTGEGNGRRVRRLDGGGYAGGLLWGKVDGLPLDGWVRTSDARIGHLDIPFRGTPTIGGRLVLAEVEYTDEDEYGNVYIVDGRYTGVELYGCGLDSCDANGKR